LSRKNKKSFKYFFVNLLKEFGISCTLVPSIANFLCNELEYENMGFSSLSSYYYYFILFLKNWLHCPCGNLALEQVALMATKSRIMLQKLLMNISKC
jgi:hypothetical protein